MKYYICNEWRICPRGRVCAHGAEMHFFKVGMCFRPCQNEVAVIQGIHGTCHEVDIKEEVMLRIMGIKYEE
jgi:hypothetical protein